MLIRCFLLHVLPDGFHRIRHYGLLASGRRAGIRQIIAAETQHDVARHDLSASPEQSDPANEPHPPRACCGGRMILGERFATASAPRTICAVRIDTS